MEVEWVVIALEDVAWIFLAFVLGFIARSVSLPPLVGYLIAGVLWAACRWRLLFGVPTQSVVGRWRPRAT